MLSCEVCRIYKYYRDFKQSLMDIKTIEDFPGNLDVFGGFSVGTCDCYGCEHIEEV